MAPEDHDPEPLDEVSQRKLRELALKLGTREGLVNRVVDRGTHTVLLDAAVERYRQRELSAGGAAEWVSVSLVEFLEELWVRHVPYLADPEGLRREVEGFRGRLPLSDVLVIDSGPLLLLARLDVLSLLTDLSDPIVPSEVLEEISSGREHDPEAVGRIDAWMAEEDVDTVSGSSPGLPWSGPGERALIATAMANPGCTVLLDGREARRYLLPSSTSQMCTPSFLLEAARKGKRTPEQVGTDLDRLADMGYYMNPRGYNEMLKILDELALRPTS